jgi:hypothetical protein
MVHLPLGPDPEKWRNTILGFFMAGSSESEERPGRRELRDRQQVAAVVQPVLVRLRFIVSQHHCRVLEDSLDQREHEIPGSVK